MDSRASCRIFTELGTPGGWEAQWLGSAPRPKIQREAKLSEDENKMVVSNNNEEANLSEIGNQPK